MGQALSLRGGSQPRSCWSSVHESRRKPAKIRAFADAAKARRNQRLHDISFRVAAETFADPFIVFQENIEDELEQRHHAIGMTGSMVLLLVVFVDRSEPDVEIIRIVSARKANDYERSAYQDQFR